MGKYVNIQSVIDGAMRYPQVREMEFADIVEWTVEVIRGLKFPMLFEDTNALRQVVNFVTEAPCDVQQIKKVDVILNINQKHFGTLDELQESENNSLTGQLPLVIQQRTFRKPLRYDTSAFNRRDLNVSDINAYNDKTVEYVYSITGDTIYTGFPFGVIEIAYQRMVVDNETGLPLILDNEELKKAIQNYILSSSCRVLYYSGKLTNDIYQDAMQKYYFSIASAHGSLQNERLLNTDVQETFGNIMKQVIMNSYAHHQDYITLGNKQAYRK